MTLHNRLIFARRLRTRTYLVFAAAATLRIPSCGSSFEFMKFVTTSVIAPWVADD
jgi:hypothetical protein